MVVVFIAFSHIYPTNTNLALNCIFLHRHKSPFASLKFFIVPVLFSTQRSLKFLNCAHIPTHKIAEIKFKIITCKASQ